MQIKEDNKIQRPQVFKFETWWVIEENFEAEVKRLWSPTWGNLFNKLETLRVGLIQWDRLVRERRRGITVELTKKLELLFKEDRSDEIL